MLRHQFYPIPTQTLTAIKLTTGCYGFGSVPPVEQGGTLAQRDRGGLLPAEIPPCFTTFSFPPTP